MIELRWALPAAPDLAFVELRRSVASPAPQTARSSAVIYRGLSTRFFDRNVQRAVRYRYLLAAVDRTGNRSASVVRTATLPLILFAPRNGSRVSTPPILRWRAASGASYYNVQLYRAGSKLITAWLTEPRYALRRSWTFDDRRYRLTPGRYTWYVWPGLGPRANARYGPLLGKSTFIVTGA